MISGFAVLLCACRLMNGMALTTKLLTNLENDHAKPVHNNARPGPGQNQGEPGTLEQVWNGLGSTIDGLKKDLPDRLGQAWDGLKKGLPERLPWEKAPDSAVLAPKSIASAESDEIAEDMKLFHGGTASDKQATQQADIYENAYDEYEENLKKKKEKDKQTGKAVWQWQKNHPFEVAKGNINKGWNAPFPYR